MVKLTECANVSQRYRIGLEHAHMYCRDPTIIVPTWIPQMETLLSESRVLGCIINQHVRNLYLEVVNQDVACMMIYVFCTSVSQGR